MSFIINFLLVLIIVYYLSKWFVTYVFPRLIMWWMHRTARKQYEQMYGQKPPQGGSSRSGFQSRKARSKARPRRRGKIISKDVGEYVEFEDIPTYNSTSQSSQPSNQDKTKKYPEESQISDAEWEDL